MHFISRLVIPSPRRPVVRSCIHPVVFPPTLARGWAVGRPGGRAAGLSGGRAGERAVGQDGPRIVFLGRWNDYKSSFFDFIIRMFIEKFQI